MKLILVTFAIFAVATANPISEWHVPSDGELRHAINECVRSNINLPVDELKKCGIKCAFEKVGYFDETTGFNVEHIVKTEIQHGRNESDARTVADRCAVRKEALESNCDWAYRGMNCLRDQEKGTKEH